MKDQSKDGENTRRDATGQYREQKAGDLDDTVDSGVREGAPSLNQEGGGLDVGERVTRIETWLQFLATREDLAKLEAGLREDLVKVEAGLREDLVKVEAGLREDLAKLEARLNVRLENCATRDDLLATREDLAKLEVGLREDLHAAISRQTKWMIATMIALVGAVIVF